jgi:hypothetical protein
LLKANGIQFKVTAVFCHGRPEVRHGRNRCELGDVLFAYFHSDAAGATYRNSLLLQAKMSANPTYSVAAADLHQLELYTKWGQFTYQRTLGLTGQLRVVTPAAAHAGAQYLLIDDGGPMNPASGVSGAPGTFAMGTAAAQRHLVIRNSLGCTLVNLMCGNDGRTFADRTAAVADWDQVVWDLIDNGRKAQFSQRRVGIAGRPRGVDVILRYALANSLIVDDDGFTGSRARVGMQARDHGEPPGPGEQELNADEPGGISLVIFETREAQELA